MALDFSKLDPQPTAWAQTKRVLGWQGFAFVFLVGIALGLAAMNDFTDARRVLGLSGLVSAVKVIAEFRRQADTKYLWPKVLCGIMVVGFLLYGGFRWINAIQQQEVYRNLKIEAQNPAPDDVVETMFSFTNNGSTDIGNHQTYCRANFAVFDNDMIVDRSRTSVPRKFQVPLHSGGDTQSDACLHAIRTVFPIRGAAKCVDVTIWIEYELATQPGMTNRKPLRFVTRTEGQHLVWHGQPTDENVSPCTGNH